MSSPPTTINDTRREDWTLYLISSPFPTCSGRLSDIGSFQLWKYGDNWPVTAGRWGISSCIYSKSGSEEQLSQSSGRKTERRRAETLSRGTCAQGTQTWTALWDRSWNKNEYFWKLHKDESCWSIKILKHNHRATDWEQKHFCWGCSVKAESTESVNGKENAS